MQFNLSEGLLLAAYKPWVFNKHISVLEQVCVYSLCNVQSLVRIRGEEGIGKVCIRVIHHSIHCCRSRPALFDVISDLE